MPISIPRLSKSQTTRLLTSRLGLARLATVDRDGTPHVVPVWFSYVRGRIVVPSPSNTLKTRNIKERSAASLVIDTYGGKLNAQGVLMQGKAHIIRGVRSRRLNRLVHTKYLGSKMIRRKKWRDFMAEDDATIVLEPRKVISWDFTKLKL